MGNSPTWVRTVTPLALADKALHVWRASLETPPAMLQRMLSTLSTDEKERAERFLIEGARERFIAGRGILRQLLGTYLGLGAAEIEFCYGPEGKPSLSRKHDLRISFNVSHSREIGLFVLASAGELGVDIEEVKPDFKGMQIASHFFSADEIAVLAKLPLNTANNGFFQCWTRKEAYVKARGQGLSIPLCSFTVGLECNEQVLRDELGGRWSCFALEPMPGFAGAVAAEGEGWKLKYYDWCAGAEVEASVALPT